MAVEHRNDPIFGLQFHPESVMTPEGKKMIENFYKNCVEKILTEPGTWTGGPAMIKEAILKLAKKQDLTYAEAEASHE